MLDHIINSTELFNKLDKININPEEKYLKIKLMEIVIVLEN